MLQAVLGNFIVENNEIIKALKNLAFLHKKFQRGGESPASLKKYMCNLTIPFSRLRRYLRRRRACRSSLVISFSLGGTLVSSTVKRCWWRMA